MAKTYIGKVCAKHPELMGERQESNHNCLGCQKERVRKYREENREAELERVRKYREENREAVLERERKYREENREARLEYNRKYREENREAELERNRKYHEENREAALERGRKYREENREAELERNRKYHEENREARLEYNRKYREENREAIAECQRKYREENREAIAECQRKYRQTPASKAMRRMRGSARRAWMKDCMKDWTEQDWVRANFIYLEAVTKTAALLEGHKWHVDHIVPKAEGGLHHPDNMRVVWDTTNMSQGAKKKHRIIGQVF